MAVRATDLATALGLTLAGQVEIWAPDLMVGTDAVEGSRPILAATTLAMTLSLAARRNAPAAVAALVAGVSALQGLVTTPTQGLTTLIVLVLAAYGVAAWAPEPVAVAAAVALLAGLVPLSADLADWAFAALLVSGSWFAGLLMRRRAEALRAAERDRDAAATSERMRIARELHDIVSHRVTTVVVQAQAAHATLATDPEATRRSLEAVDVAGRQALAELRDLLGVLRTDGGAGGRAPQPGLEDLPRLVDEARARGVPASLTVEGAAYDVEPGIALAAYRVVQEALTNVAKHAGSAPTEVLVRYGSGALEVHVVDTGPGGPARRRGHGLVGMEERAALYGGSVQAGEAAGGGFAVRLALPVRTS